MRQYQLWIQGEARASHAQEAIRNPYQGDVVAQMPLAQEDDLEAAIVSGTQAAAQMRAIPSYRRAEALQRLREGMSSRREEFARVIAQEAGKPIKDARVETDRAISVLALSAEESKRIGGEVLPLDLLPGAEGRFGLTRRFPIGLIAGITPFNFPLNLGMHKVGPALAAGNAIIWKPSLQAPGAAYLFAELFARAAEELDMPRAALTVITPPDELAERLVTDARIRMVSFTGSARVGWKLRSLAGPKRVALELGGNAATIIAADADLDFAAQRCVAGGFGYAGQTCISVQRIWIEEPVYEEFLTRFLPLVRALRVGDPSDENTRMGPVISEKEASRVEQWIDEAREGGARALTGGERHGLFIEPTVLANASSRMQVSCSEVFGPVVTVAPFRSWEEALAQVNDSEFGLQTGVFTRDLSRAFRAFEVLEVGGVVVNDVPSFRVDSMPYGGVKQSGLGREGIRYAIEEMTDERLLVMNPHP